MTRSRTTTVLLAAVLLVGAANLGAYAATGAPLLLGKANTASKTTTIKTTGNGPALSLTAKKGKPPLKVSSKAKVKKLNADALDGLDSKALRTRAYTYPLPALDEVDSLNFSLKGLPPGVYDASYSVSGEPTTTTARIACLLAPLDHPEAATIKLSNVGTVFDFTSDTLAVSASGLVDTRKSEYYFNCVVDTGDISLLASSSQVTFVRVDEVVTGSTGPVFRGATAEKAAGR